MFRLSAAGLALFLVATLGCARFLPTTPASPPAAPEEARDEALSQLPFAMPREGANPRWQEARGYFFRAYRLQIEGRLTEAIEHYQLSIAAYPTAEAYTFLGWTYSWMGRYEQAIAEAQRAISLDPDLGNPYNDIGVYLTSLGKLDEAIPWLNRAMLAPRYASPHYPWLNLGNIWMLKGEWGRAAACYREALRLAEDYPVPPLVALPAAMFLPPEAERHPGTASDQEKVKAALARYFDAWSRYDAAALHEVSAPPTSGESRALVMNLVAAERRGSPISYLESRVLHLQADRAVATTKMQISGESQEVLHLLGRYDGVWKVIIPLYLEPSPSPPGHTL